MSQPFISGATSVVGVFGFPVEHTLSPAMHNAAFAALRIPYIYVPFRVPPHHLGAALGSLSSLGIIGVNLTVPHKVAALPYMDEVSREAREVGAVNTIHCCEGKLIGDNTDGYGFYTPLAESGWESAGGVALILGAGGAARSVAFQLAREGVQVTIANRTPERSLSLAKDVAAAGYPKPKTIHWNGTKDLSASLAECNLLVNTTQVGMHPQCTDCPLIPFEDLRASTLVYDLIYNPAETELIRRAKLAGSRTMTGLKMLVHQGAAAFHRWTGVWPPVEIMERAVLEGLRNDRQD